MKGHFILTRKDVILDWYQEINFHVKNDVNTRNLYPDGTAVTKILNHLKINLMVQ